MTSQSSRLVVKLTSLVNTMTIVARGPEEVSDRRIQYIKIEGSNRFCIQLNII